MKQLKLTGGTFEIYDDIKEMPIHRYKDFQKYLMQAAGIGSTMQDVDKHFRVLDRQLTAGRISEAIQERENLHMNLYMILNKINIKDIAFACLIKSINGQPIYDTTEEALIKLTERLGKMGLTKKDIDTLTETVKKKLTLS